MKLLYSIDLDGTLLDAKLRVSEESKEQIIKAFNNGQYIAFNTGRGFTFTDNLMKRVFPDHYHLFTYATLNGSYIYQYDKNKNVKVIRERSIDHDAATEIIKFGLKKHYKVHLNDDYKLYGMFSPSKLALGVWGNMKSAKLDLDSYDSFLKIQLFKLNKLKNEEMIDVIKERWGKYVSCTSSFGRLAVEITGNEANKGEAIIVFKKLFKNADVISLGDSGNDLSAFAQSHHAYVPSTCEDIIKKKSKAMVIDNPRNNFVANVIKQLEK